MYLRAYDDGLLQKPKVYRISGHIFGLISSFLSSKWLLDGDSLQEHRVNAGVPLGSILGPHGSILSYYTLMNILMMLSVILLFMLMILLSTLNVIRHLICDNN